MSNLTDLLPAGAGGKQVNFVASGTLSSGQTVALNGNGTVTAVGTNIAEALGTPAIFAGSQSAMASTFDTDQNKLVVVYADGDNSDFGTAVVGTVSGTSISFGTPVVFETARATSIAATFDTTTNKVVVIYGDAGNSFNGTAIVGTVSGTSISFGSAVVFEAASTSYTSVVYDSTNEKVVVAYTDGGNSNYGTAIVGTVSGTSISFGTSVIFLSGYAIGTGSVYDASSQKILVAYRNFSNQNRGESRVGTVSGTSISFGSSVTYGGAFEIQSNTLCAYDSQSQKIVIAYSSSETSTQYGWAVVGTISGTSVSYGTRVTFNGNRSNRLAIGYDPTANKVVIAYRNRDSSDKGYLRYGEVSGTSISFSSALLLNDEASATHSLVYANSAAKMVVSSYLATSVDSQSVTYQPPYSISNTSFIGISDAAISDTASGSVTIKGGISTNVTGLTPNALYYVQTDGSLGSPTASVPYVINGASYDSVSFSVAGQETTPLGMIFGNNGTKMYIVGAGASVYQYTLSSGFDLSTASYDSVSFSVTSQDTSPRGIAFNLTGEKMFIIGQGSDAIYQYTLSIAWDVSSASYDSASFSVSAQDTTPQDLFFNLDGSKFFMVGDTTDTVYQYSLSTPFVISSASYDSVSFSAASQSTGCVALSFNNTGTRMFISDYQNDTIYQYSLSSGFDLSTASYDSINFSVASQSDNPQGLAFSSDGTTFFVTTVTGSSVLQYSTGAGSVTSVLAGKALSSTSINLDYTT